MPRMTALVSYLLIPETWIVGHDRHMESYSMPRLNLEAFGLIRA